MCASNYSHLDIVSTCLDQGLRPLLIAVAGGQQRELHAGHNVVGRQLLVAFLEPAVG